MTFTTDGVVVVASLFRARIVVVVAFVVVRDDDVGGRLPEVGDVV